jgi:ribosome-associated protein
MIPPDAVWQRYFKGQAIANRTVREVQRVVTIAEDKQAGDILLLDTREKCGFADFFVILSGDNERQVNAIYEEISHQLKKEGVYAHHVEGTPDSGWLLLDYNDVIVHIFSPAERGNYRLEELWAAAKPVVRIL